MLTLLIETSTERGIVALLRNRELLFHQELPVGFNNSQMLLPILEKSLAPFTIKEIDLIAVGVGPGSYTGIRMGAITAKIFAYTHKIPLVGVCSLYGFIPSYEGEFAAVIDAKISGAYVMTGYRKAHSIQYHNAASVIPIEQLPHLLQDTTTVITPNKSRLQPLLPANWNWTEKAPCPLHMADYAYSQYHAGQQSNAMTLDLLYMRKTQAEIEREKIMGRNKPDSVGQSKML